MDPAQKLEAQEIARHTIVNETIARFDSPVQRFYEGAVVFITGASGFLGKSLIEKLFRSCNVAKLYVLLRPKKKKNFDERVRDLAQDEVYEYLKKTQPNFWENIIPIQGDVSEVGLGLSEEDRKIIIEEVTIIIHGAATINFVESMKVATFTNVRGTLEMIKLGKECKKLKSYVHISTAYSHATYPRAGEEVLEQFYQTPISHRTLVELAETLAEDQLDAMTPKLIKNWPNTYAFTKAVAEDAVRCESGDLPICIVRPAIVIAALREPMPGWIDPSSAFGPTGLLIGVGLGIIHIIQARAEINLDLVPVDLVNNAVLAAAFTTTMRRERGERDVKIYTLTCTRNPLKFDFMIDIFTGCEDLATDKNVMYGGCWFTNKTVLYRIIFMILHIIPAFLVDGILKLLGKKPLLMMVYKKMAKLNGVLSYYMTNDWHFGDSNLRDLYWKLSPPDRLIFDCNTDTISWDHYLRVWIIGARKYIIKDGLSRTNIGAKKQFYFRYLWFLVIIPLYMFAMYKMVYYSSYIVYYILSTTFDLL